MKTVLLMRHAKSSWDNPALEEKPVRVARGFSNVDSRIGVERLKPVFGGPTSTEGEIVVVVEDEVFCV